MKKFGKLKESEKYLDGIYVELELIHTRNIYVKTIAKVFNNKTTKMPL